MITSFQTATSVATTPSSNPSGGSGGKALVYLALATIAVYLGYKYIYLPQKLKKEQESEIKQ